MTVPDTMVLEVEHLTKSFGVRVLDELSLSVGAGEALGIVGPNGAGKTTLIDVVAGDLRPDGGTVRFAGRDITRDRADRRCRAGLARTAQVPRPFEQMTVFENVLCVMERSALPWQPGGRAAAGARRERADATIAQVGLTAWRDARAIDLGYAEQKFLSLARILVTDATLWLLDEPASGLDPASYDRFVKLVRGRLSDGITICLIEHNLDIVHGISDRIAFLDRGTVLAAGEPRAILNDPKLAAIYFGERR